VNLKRETLSTLSIPSRFLGCSKEVIVKRRNERDLLLEGSKRVRRALPNERVLLGRVYSFVEGTEEAGGG
jgi:hypothetical protein